MNDVNVNDPFEAVPSRSKLKRAARKAKARARAQAENSVASDPDAAFISLVFDVRAIDGDVASMNARRKNRLKQARADGVDTAVALLVMREMKLTGDEMIDRENAKNRYRELVGMPHHTQLTLESRATKEKDILANAEAEGKRRAYLGGSTSQNPHEPGLPAGQAWLRGFNDATAIIGKLVKPSVATKVRAAAKE